MGNKIKDMFTGTKVKLISLELPNIVLDTDNGAAVALRAIYQINRLNGAIEEVTFPCIVLPFYMDQMPDICARVRYGVTEANFGFGNTCLLPDSEGKMYTIKTIKEADPKEMTIAEIEKLIGCPIKIVEEK